MGIITERAHLETTGGKVWDAAKTTFDHLKGILDQAASERGTVLNILELGSGCGWLGMSIAAFLGERGRVVVTEQENGGAFDWLKHNLSLNPSIKNIEALPLDWIKVEDGFKKTKWDFIIGSELVYSPITCKLLPECIKQLISPETRVYYAHNMNRFEALDLQLIENFRSCGLSVESTFQELPNFLGAQLFPDLRLEILQISL
jgi:hypothetical protein